MVQRLRSKAWQGMELFKFGRYFFLSSCLVFSGTPSHSSLEDRLKSMYASFFCVTFNGLSRCAPHLTAGCVRNTGVGWGSVAVSLMDREVAEVRLKIWQQSKETEYYKRKYGWSRVERLCQILNNAFVQSCDRKGWIIEPCVYLFLA